MTRIAIILKGMHCSLFVIYYNAIYMIKYEMDILSSEILLPSLLNFLSMLNEMLPFASQIKFCYLHKCRLQHQEVRTTAAELNQSESD